LCSRSVIEIGAVRNAPQQRTQYDAVFAFAGQDKPGFRKGSCGESTTKKRRKRRLFPVFLRILRFFVVDSHSLSGFIGASQRDMHA
jgi:hypothetical protein